MLRRRLALLLVLAAAPGCGDDGTTPDTETDGGADSGRRPTGDAGDTDDAGSPDVDTDAAVDDASADATPDAQTDVPTSDAGVDTVSHPDLGLPCYIDEDGDGAYAIVCGGDDCNDGDPRMKPGLPERCDTLDNDCSGLVNDGVDCRFFAQTADRMYAIDPFLLQLEPLQDVPRLTDMDTHPDGTLYGVSSTTLYRYQPSNDRWQSVGELTGFSGSPTGMAIDLSGRAVLTAGTQVWAVDLGNGSATLVGEMGGAFRSSGDCVVNKDNTIFMSSRGEAGDDLVVIDGATGEATLIGPIGFERVYGLTAAWGSLYGLTTGGELVRIDERTGEGTEVMTFSGVQWWGAASAPGR